MSLVGNSSLRLTILKVLAPSSLLRAVVPLHAKDALPVKDQQLTKTGRTTALEYDGLESGELAWVLSSQTKAGPLRAVPVKPSESMPTTRPPDIGADTVLVNGPIQHQMGFGVDRFQRLAYTAWVESLIENRIGTCEIDLKAFNMFSDQCRELDSDLDFWATKGCAGGDLFALPDVAYGLQRGLQPDGPGGIFADTEERVQVPMPQGLFVMERGPFLRSIGVDHRAIKIGLLEAPAALNGQGITHIPSHYVDRHLGSELAQKGLQCALKLKGLMNWVPDGVCMSKYETGPNPMSDAELDARASQLFNVAVQGPAITKTWTNDAMLQCMPMDKVFMLVVADLSYTLDTAANTRVAEAAAATTRYVDATRDAQNRARMQRDGATNRVIGMGGTAAQVNPVFAGMGAKPAAGTAGGGGGVTAVEAAYAAWLGRPGTNANVANNIPADWNAPAAGNMDGMEAVRLPRPVLPADVLSIRTTVLEQGRESSKRRDQGVLKLHVVSAVHTRSDVSVCTVLRYCVLQSHTVSAEHARSDTEVGAVLWNWLS